MPYTPAAPTETNNVEEGQTLDDGSLMNFVFTDNRQPLPTTRDESHSFVTNCSTAYRERCRIALDEATMLEALDEATMLERLRESITESNIPIIAMCFDGIIVRDTMASQPSDEMQISDEDIELVMSQTGVSRSRAFTALKDNDNNIFEAIMDLTM